MFTTTVRPCQSSRTIASNDGGLPRASGRESGVFAVRASVVVLGVPVVAVIRRKGARMPSMAEDVRPYALCLVLPDDAGQDRDGTLGRTFGADRNSHRRLDGILLR